MGETLVRLGNFEGHEVVATGVEITNAGDGLSKSMAVDPTKLAIGERGYVVIEFECKRVKHEAVKDAPTKRTRVHVLRAETATFIDGELVGDAIEKQRIRIEEHAGVRRLGFGDDEGEGDADG